MRFKKLLPLLFLLFLCKYAFSQLEVKEGSFKEVPGFVNINPDPNYQIDDKNMQFAVIKVRTENINDKQRRNLRFDGNDDTFIMLEYKTGEVWVYITAKYAEYLKISHPDFKSTEYWLPFDLEPKKGYEMTLVNKPAPAQIEVIYNSVLISTDQDSAYIYIDGDLAGKKEVLKTYKAGETHEWRIECDLFKTENGKVTMPNKDGESIIIDKQLQPEYGYIYVTSSPEDGAIVYIDGKMCGQTPYESDKLSVGEHEVKVMKDLFIPFEKTFVVNDKDTTQAEMTIKANYVSVTATTDSESEIYVDNEKKGVGRWSGRLSDGSHRFEARKASHRASIKDMQLVLGKDEKITIPNPEPIYGTLKITSSPIGANIIIDGENHGTTPKVITDVIIGNHELRLTMNGCSSVTKSFTLDETNKITIKEHLPIVKHFLLEKKRKRGSKELSLNAGLSIPLGKYGKTSDTKWSALMMMGDVGSIGYGAAVCGWAAGLKLHIPVYKDKDWNNIVGIVLQLHFLHNGLSRKEYNKFSKYLSDEASDLNEYYGKLAYDYSIEKFPKYSNVSIMFGLDYTHYFTDIFAIFGELSCGLNAIYFKDLKISNNYSGTFLFSEGGYDYYSSDGFYMVYKSLPNAVFEIGCGVFLNNRISLGMYYMNFTPVALEASTKTFDLDEISSYEGEILKIQTLNIKLGVHF